MVGYNCGRGGVLYITFPETQSMLDGEQLFLLSRIIELRPFEFLSVKDNWMKQAFVTALQEHTTKGPFRNISFNSERSMDIGLGKHRSLDQFPFQQLKGGFSTCSPGNRPFFLLIGQLVAIP